jgi:hypothetical protein
MKISLQRLSGRSISWLNSPNPVCNWQPLIDTFRVRAVRESRINRSVLVSRGPGFSRDRSVSRLASWPKLNLLRRSLMIPGNMTCIRLQLQQMDVWWRDQR